LSRITINDVLIIIIEENRDKFYITSVLVMKKNQNGKVVLITGGASGVGYFIAKEFAHAGANLIIIDIDSLKLKQAKIDLEKLGIGVNTYVVDVAQKDQVDKMAKDVLKQGGVDILINNAGIGHQSEIAKTDFPQWKKLMNINFWGPLYHIYAFLPHMQEKKSGHIVNISSGQSWVRLPTWVPYAVTKLALGALSEVMHYELLKYNIPVTTVYPYLINTGFYDGFKADTWISWLALKFMPLYSDSPEAVAKLVYKAVEKKKQVEMVNIVTSIGRWLRYHRPFMHVINRVFTPFLTNDKSVLNRIIMGSALTEKVSETGRLLSTITNGKFGFQMNEIMSGEHEFVNGFGPIGKRPFKFTVDWGTDNFKKWLDPDNNDFLVNDLEGLVTVGGLCTNRKCRGTLELHYHDENKIHYTFEFNIDGKSYLYRGEKRNIKPWNLHKTHTKCYGKLWEKESGKLVSTSVTYFRLGTLIDFLSSFKFKLDLNEDLSNSNAPMAASTRHNLAS